MANSEIGNSEQEQAGNGRGVPGIFYPAALVVLILLLLWSLPAMREVIGRNTIDDVLTGPGAIGQVAAELLQEILDGYDSGLWVASVELQNVQPPESVRDAFDDVIAANQDRNRKVSEDEGYANEVVPRARAEAVEVLQQAAAYRDAKIAEANGEAQRFLAIVSEYQKAPEITRKRLYLETMEEVLPGVEKVLIEPGTASVLPYLPLGTVKGGKE